MPDKCVLRNHHQEGEVSPGQHYQRWGDGGNQAPRSRLPAPAPEPSAWVRLCPASPEWWLLVPGLRPTPSWDCAPGSHCQLQRDRPPHHARFWADSCLFQCIRWGWMWEKLIFQPEKEYENPVPALKGHRRKKGLVVSFCQCIFFYFSYFNKCFFREEGRSGNSNNHCRYYPFWIYDNFIVFQDC